LSFFYGAKIGILGLNGSGIILFLKLLGVDKTIKVMLFFNRVTLLLFRAGANIR
jgi:hypothetical protein